MKHPFVQIFRALLMICAFYTQFNLYNDTFAHTSEHALGSIGHSTQGLISDTVN